MGMTKEEIRGLVNEGFRLDQEKKVLEEKIEAIKDRLKVHADGARMEFLGDGCKAVVGYTARIASVIVDEKLLAKARKVCGEYFEKLFCWAPRPKFADVSAALLGDKAAALVEDLKGLPAPTVSFKKA